MLISTKALARILGWLCSSIRRHSNLNNFGASNSYENFITIKFQYLDEKGVNSKSEFR
jgi:hypothetical protein